MIDLIYPLSLTPFHLLMDITPQHWRESACCAFFIRTKKNCQELFGCVKEGFKNSMEALESG
jgi:hypothetical protein